jgi:hypothetical protein
MAPLTVKRSKLGFGLLAGQHCGAEFGQGAAEFIERLPRPFEFTLQRVALGDDACEGFAGALP